MIGYFDVTAWCWNGRWRCGRLDTQIRRWLARGLSIVSIQTSAVYVPGRVPLIHVSCLFVREHFNY